MRIELKALPPAEAVALFRQKGLTIGFAWQDVWKESHAAAFTVAKAMRADVLEAIRKEVDRALIEGRTLRQFRNDLTPTLQKLGWRGKAPVTDPLTSETVLAQLGSPRRLRTIYDVNMRASLAAGQWQRINRVRARRPYLRYSAVLDDRTRPDHRAWHGTVLRIDDPWWNTHFPPNGWNAVAPPSSFPSATSGDLSLRSERARRFSGGRFAIGALAKLPRCRSASIRAGITMSETPGSGAYDRWRPTNSRASRPIYAVS